MVRGRGRGGRAVVSERRRHVRGVTSRSRPDLVMVAARLGLVARGVPDRDDAPLAPLTVSAAVSRDKGFSGTLGALSAVQASCGPSGRSAAVIDHGASLVTPRSAIVCGRYAATSRRPRQTLRQTSRAHLAFTHDRTSGTHPSPRRRTNPRLTDNPTPTNSTDVQTRAPNAPTPKAIITTTETHDQCTN